MIYNGKNFKCTVCKQTKEMSALKQPFKKICNVCYDAQRVEMGEFSKPTVSEQTKNLHNMGQLYPNGSVI